MKKDRKGREWRPLKGGPAVTGRTGPCVTAVKCSSWRNGRVSAQVGQRSRPGAAGAARAARAAVCGVPKRSATLHVSSGFSSILDKELSVCFKGFLKGFFFVVFFKARISTRPSRLRLGCFPGAGRRPGEVPCVAA